MNLDRYVDVLKSHKISIVIDVRETPWSYKPGFSKKPLAERLDAEGISYLRFSPSGTGNVDFTQLQTIDTVLSGLGLELHREVATLPIYTVEQIQQPTSH